MEEIVTTDAGAVTPESPVAESVSETTVTPEVTEESAETVTPETEAAEPADAEAEKTESGPTEKHQKTLEQRVQELVEKRLSEQEQRINQKLQPAPALDFIPDIDMTKVNKYIQDTREEIEQLQLEGRYWEAEELADQLNATKQQVRDNEAKKAAHMQEREQQQMTQQQTDAINTQIVNASKLVAQEYNIPQEVWQKAEDWFIQERQNKPLIDVQYREKVLLQGPVAALLWAKEYVEKNMGKEEQDLLTTKETAKATLPQGKVASGMQTDAVSAKLEGLRKQAASGSASDLAAYSAALRESRKQ